jgi:hypothetical protein
MRGKTIPYEMKHIVGNIGKCITTTLPKQKRVEYGEGIVATLSQQLSWNHFIELLVIEDNLKREFYMQLSKNERWSISTLRERIGNMLYERTALSKSRKH